MEQNRKHKRIEKKISLQFCVADASPRKWDMSVIQNISAGGVKFSIPSDLVLKDKVVQLQIRIPELMPRFLDVEALVLEVKPRLINPKYSDVRVKFINLTDVSKELLSILEKVIDRLEEKNASKGKF
jgi:hypothetical protein